MTRLRSTTSERRETRVTLAANRIFQKEWWQVFLLFVLLANTSVAQTTSPYWLDGFGSTGVTGGAIATLQLDGDRLLVGGVFHLAGEQLISNVASYDPNLNVWSSIVEDVNGTLEALALGGDDDVFVGGASFSAGGMTGINVARWDGAQWHPLGEGLDGPVADLAYYDGALYAVGQFESSGTVPLNGVAVWNGERWEALDGGLRHELYTASGSSVEVDEAGRVYVGGRFDRAGSTTSNSFAIWEDGEWRAPERPLSSTDPFGVVVHSITLSNEDVIVGGVFTHAGADEVHNIARYRRGMWEPFGSGLPDSYIFDVARTPDGEIVAVGSIADRFSLARFDGHEWQLVERVQGRLEAVAIEILPDSRYVVGHVGSFSPEGGNPSQLLYTWSPHDGSWGVVDWTQQGIDGPVHAVVPSIHGDGYYVGGTFAFAGSTKAHNVAYWNGQEWEALGDGLDGTVKALALTSTGDLYAGGQFNRSGETTLSCVARWDGEQWHALGTGVVYSAQPGLTRVHALTVHQNELYVGGLFTLAGPAYAPFLATWSLTQSEWVDSGARPNGPVYALWSDDLQLVIGGAFSTLGNSVNAAGVARRQDGVWYDMGLGTEGSVTALAGGQGSLYAGGRFGSSAVASWNGAEWVPMDIRMPDGGVETMLLGPGGQLYVGGTFTLIEQSDGTTVAAQRLAIINDQSIVPLGIGGVGIPAGDHVSSSIVLALARDGSDLVIGGAFSTVGAEPGEIHGHTPSLNIAVQANATYLSTDRYKKPFSQSLTATVHPNPTAGPITITASAPIASRLDITIYDLLGREIRRERFNVTAGDVVAQMDLTPLPAGAYLLKVMSKEHGSSTESLLMVTH